MSPRIPYGQLASTLESTWGFDASALRETWEMPARTQPADRLPPALAKELFWALMKQAEASDRRRERQQPLFGGG